MRCVQRHVLRWYDKNNDSSNFWNLTNDAPWILLIRGPGIRVPSSAPKGRQIAETNGLSSFLFYTGFLGLYLWFFQKIQRSEAQKWRRSRRIMSWTQARASVSTRTVSTAARRRAASRWACCWCWSKNICRTQKTDGFPGWRADGLFVQNRKILERKRPANKSQALK